MVSGDVQALGPAIPVKTAFVVDPPLGFSEVLHERDAPHRGRRLALGFLERDGAGAKAQAAIGAVVRSCDRDGVRGTGTVFRAPPWVEKGVVLTQTQEVMMLLVVCYCHGVPVPCRHHVPIWLA